MMDRRKRLTQPRAGVMLSIARSRLTILAQLSFLAINGLGVFTSIVYNKGTPDLYPNNAHHKLGWVLTWIAIAWFVMALPMILGKSSPSSAHPMTMQNMARYNRLHNDEEDGFSPAPSAYRVSRDADSATLCSGARSPTWEPPYHKLEPQPPAIENPQSPFIDHEAEASESSGFLATAERSHLHCGLSTSRLTAFLFSLKLVRFSPSGSALTALAILYTAIERTIIVLAFVALCTGLITWGNLFRDRLVFSGAAHFIKGGIFFWYGVLTLGRWMGAFAEFGWAWNVKPSSTSPYCHVRSASDPVAVKQPKTWIEKMPSAEFVESFVIWLYGASNIFLEHLNAWGQEWTFEDFEHISITVMFFGGGMLGMLVESSTFTNLFNAGLAASFPDVPQHRVVFLKGLSAEAHRDEGWQRPKTHKTSLNPIPALVILLLGRMMSGHFQTSMVSTMMHAQWGSLFVGFAIARNLTYVLLYLCPPTSFFPSRPPTELVASFCLISGGLIFMGSATDTVAAIEGNGLDAMFLFTVVMGFSALFMAWAGICFGIKGWAVRRAAKRAA